MPSKLLNIVNACAYYGQIQALHDVSLYVSAGEVVTLIGANGAGKSTLMMAIFGYPHLRSGQVFIGDVEVTNLAAHKLATMGVTLVPEGRRIFPQMTVYENLLTGTTTQLDVATLARVYDTFPVLASRKHQRAGTLSGGEQQMLAIGRGLMSNPRLLLLDEPSLGLAPLVIKQIFAVLAKIAAAGTTIFLVEQNASVALKFAQRGYVLVNGKIELAGDCDTLMHDDTVRQAYLG
ncbi:MAG: ABC transporter ATP-binding protein [Pseudomonadota bacterium]|nr:ABC transporter ATP-binding protein [Pseudomonadota bacterium]